VQQNIRSATTSDKEQILEISKTIWEGNDFILRTIDTWLDPDSGKILVIDEGGEIRAFAKMSYLTTEDYWLEGLRVKEKYRGMGYANLLTKSLIEEAKKAAPRSLRFACHRKAVGSIRSGENHGFIRKGEFNFILCETLNFDRTSPKNSAPRVGEVRELSRDTNPLEKLQEFPEFARQLGFLFGSKWKFIPPEEGLLHSLHQQGKILVTEEEKDLLIYDKDGEDLRILFYGGREERIREMILSLGKKEPGKLFKTMTLPNSKFNRVFQQLGFHMKGEPKVELPPNVFLYEYPLL
jgi:N-acetylglutamate synthase-like GNAT family acetyltransferase